MGLKTFPQKLSQVNTLSHTENRATSSIFTIIAVKLRVSFNFARRKKTLKKLCNGNLRLYRGK